MRGGGSAKTDAVVAEIAHRAEHYEAMHDATLKLMARIDDEVSLDLDMVSMRDGIHRHVATGARLPRNVVRVVVVDGDGTVAGYYYVPINALPRVLRTTGIRRLQVLQKDAGDLSGLAEYKADVPTETAPEDGGEDGDTEG